MENAGATERLQDRSSAIQLGRLRDRVVVVTGGANGLGRAYCRHLVREGARVVIADLDGDGATVLAAELNRGDGESRATAIEVDVTSEPQVAEMVRFARASFGTIDVLINNAGTYPHAPFRSITYDEWRRIMAVNLDSVFLCCQAVLEPMIERGEGSIINVATNLVWPGLAEMVHYIAAKSGVVGLTRSLAREIGQYRIRVNALAPGPVIPDTDRLRAIDKARVEALLAYQCIKRPQRAEDLLGVVIFLASRESDFISGQVFTVDGGLTMH